MEFKMKKYRRIEITAFRRRVTIMSDTPTNTAEVGLEDTDSSEAIKTDSAEGREILSEAVRLLEEQLCKSNV